MPRCVFRVRTLGRGMWRPGENGVQEGGGEAGRSPARWHSQTTEPGADSPWGRGRILLSPPGQAGGSAMESPAEREGGRSGQVLQDGKRVPAAPGKWFQESPGRRRWEKRSNTYESRACGWMDWVGAYLGLRC